MNSLAPDALLKLHRFATPSDKHVDQQPIVYQGRLHHEQTDDVHELACSITGWQQLYHQLKPGLFSGELQELWLDGIQLYSERTNIALLQNCMIWPGSFWFGLSPSKDIDTETTCAVLQPEKMALAAGGKEFELSIPQDFFMQGLVINSGLLMELLERSVECDLSSFLYHHDALPISSWHKNRFRHLLQQALRLGHHTPELLLHDVSRKSLQHEILDSLICILQSATGHTAPVVSNRSYPALIRKARSFVLDNPYQTITVTDLINHLNVSRRTLQNCFVKELGITPLAYLKAIRLNAVRRELLSEHSPYSTVQDAAMAWGFWHLSQFAVDYRHFFAEKPSDTLLSRGRLQRIWQQQLTRTS